jgi:mitochondrial intermembrane space import and assembly protein 40
MQECFRQYPEIYGAELAEEEAALQEGQAEAPVAAVPEDLSSQKVQDAVPATHDATTATDAKPADAEVSAPAADVKEASPEAKEEPKQEKKKE